MKTLGVVLVFSGTGIWGLAGARCMQQRCHQLAQLKTALAFLEKEIVYTYTSLSLAMEKTAAFAGSPACLLFAECARQLQQKKGVTAQEAWLGGVAHLRQGSQLRQQELLMAANLAQLLGVSNAESQRKALILLQKELELVQEKARQEADSNQKLWSYGGFIVGSAIVLLLL